VGTYEPTTADMQGLFDASDISGGKINSAGTHIVEITPITRYELLLRTAKTVGGNAVVKASRDQNGQVQYVTSLEDADPILLQREIVRLRATRQTSDARTAQSEYQPLPTWTYGEMPRRTHDYQGFDDLSGKTATFRTPEGKNITRELTNIGLLKLVAKTVGGSVITTLHDLSPEATEYNNELYKDRRNSRTDRSADELLHGVIVIGLTPDEFTNALLTLDFSEVDLEL
jgi:uncharacterized protein YbjQ (UPF0145 family)